MHQQNLAVQAAAKRAGERERELRKLEKNLGHKFRELNLLNIALTHPSYSNERVLEHGDNDRLEFLGDAVLELVVSEKLYMADEAWQPGKLSKVRTRIVENKQLILFAKEIELSKYLLLGNSERKRSGENTKVLADAFEAVVGAMYYDGGLGPPARLLRRLLYNSPFADLALPDAKTRLKELADKRGLAPPQYSAIDAGDGGGNNRFTVEVNFDGRRYGPGVGRNKRAAEQEAARAALGQIFHS